MVKNELSVEKSTFLTQKIFLEPGMASIVPNDFCFKITLFFSCQWQDVLELRLNFNYMKIIAPQF